jgi:hypothetical protein
MMVDWRAANLEQILFEITRQAEWFEVQFECSQALSAVILNSPWAEPACRARFVSVSKEIPP